MCEDIKRSATTTILKDNMRSPRKEKLVNILDITRKGETSDYINYYNHIRVLKFSQVEKHNLNHVL